MRYTLFLAVLALTILSNTGVASSPPALFNMKTKTEFTAQDNVLTAFPGKQASIQLNKEYSPGWYRFRCEYKTSGFESMGSFIADIYGRSSLHPWQAVSPSTDWALLELYCKLNKAGRVDFRVTNMKGCSNQAKVMLRNFTFEKFEMPVDKNLLGNPELKSGSIGQIPATWTWKYHGKTGDYSLTKNSSFKGLKRVLQVKCNDKSRTLQGINMPLKSNGTITFSVWARTDNPDMSLNLMLIGDHYKWQHGMTYNVTGSWKKYNISAAAPTDSKQEYFWPRIGVSGKGSILLSGFSLIWSDSLKKSEEKKSSPKQLSDNMVTNPGFELGWNGWMLDHFQPNSYKTFITKAESKESKILPGKGVAGSYGFLMNDRTALISSCIPIRVGQKYTLSFYAKPIRQNGRIGVHLIDPAWAMHRKEVKIVSKDWKRYSTTFTWTKPSKQKKAYVRLDGDGILLDNIQFERGDLTDFKLPSVDMGIITDSNNVFPKGAEINSLKLKAVISKRVKKKVSITLLITDAWKRKISEKTFHAPGGKTRIFPLKLPANKYGVFDITLIAKDSSGRETASAKSRYAVINPVIPEVDTPLPLFGINYESYRMALWSIKRTMHEMKLLGARLNRFFINTKFFVEDPPEKFIKLFKQQCALQRKDNIFTLVGSLSNLPTELNKKIDAGNDISPEVIEKYQKIVRSVVSPLQNEIEYWEVLNEPNLWRYKKGARKGFKAMPPEKYIKILKAAYKCIKSVNPKLKVVGVCLNGTDYEYLEKVLRLGGARYMDVFSFHSYRSTPDLPEVYGDLCKFRKLLQKYGFNGPMINTEQYFAAKKFMLRNSDEESRRGYFVPGSEELRSCGRTIRNFIQHAAAGVPYCAFAPEYTFFRYGGHDKFYLFYLFGAYNAATHFIQGAGRGYPVSVGVSMRCFIFPDAPNGPLLTIYTPDPSLKGSMKLNGKYTAYDVMGNAITESADSHGLPLSTDPIYVKFKEGTQVGEIKKLLLSADTKGLGVPFDIKMQVKNQNSVSIIVTNTKNKPITGKLSLIKIPSGWECAQRTVSFENIKPGEERSIDFSGKMPMASMEKYSLSVAAESSDEYLNKKLEIAPVFSQHINRITVDGDLSEWNNAKWIKLGADHYSKAFAKNPQHENNSDLAAEIALTWNKGFLGIALKVHDKIDVNSKSPATAYEYDSVQLFFDQLNNAHSKNSSYDNDDVSYIISRCDGKSVAWVDKGSSGRYLGEANSNTGIDREVSVEIVRKGEYTIYEIKIPQQCLPLTRLERGKCFGFSILINDNDGKGRKTGLTLSPKGTEPYNKPFFFKDLFIVPK